MKITQLISKVNEYFVDKIVRKDYDLVDVDRYTANIVVKDKEGNKYPFCLWIGNGVSSVHTYGLYDNFMTLSFNEEQKKLIYHRFRSIIEEREEKQKREEYKRLKKEFEQ